MATTTARQPQKSKNALNLFLNEYFQAIIAAALILFLVLAYFIFLGPRYSTAENTIQNNIENEQNLYTNNLKKLESYRAISEIYKKMDLSDLRRFNSVLPDDYAPERLYGEIEEVVAQGGWSVSNLVIKKPGEATASAATSTLVTVGENIGHYDLELTVGSIDYAGLKNLLRIMETNLRLFDVTNVSFSPSDSSAKLTLTTYYYKRTP